LILARADFLRELKCLVTTMAFKLMNGHSFCHVTETPSSLEAKNCKLWMLNQLTNKTFSGCIHKLAIGATPSTEQDTRENPANSVVEILKAFKEELQDMTTPIGHVRCKQVIFDQVEALEKKLDIWAPPSDVMDHFEQNEPKRVRKWDLEN
jgi:hypothetical protein